MGLEVEDQKRKANHALPRQSKDEQVDEVVAVGLGFLGSRAERQAHENFCTHFVLWLCRSLDHLSYSPDPVCCVLMQTDAFH